ncbi:MAG: alanine--glyoxylate aminotransferase family protein [Actinomycetota bacterium]
MIDPHNLPALPALMIAGPGELHDDDLAAFGHQTIAHYGDTWTALHNETLDALASLLGTKSRPYLVPGTGTTAMEMAILNIFEPGQRVVIADTGFFGFRLIEIATALGLEVISVPVELGAPADPERIAEQSAGADGIITVHVDTSTGVRHPIAEIAEVASSKGIAYVVDGIAAAGGEEVDVESMGIDSYVTGTQKGLEAPPGLGIVALSDKGHQRIADRKTPVRSWYLDIATWDKYRDEWGAWHPHPVTMPTSLVLALASSLRRIDSFGPQRYIDARRTLAAELREGLLDLGFKPVPQPGCEANLVVAAWADDPAKLQAELLKEGIMISGGLGPTHAKAIRVGLMGRTATIEMVTQLLAAMKRSI